MKKKVRRIIISLGVVGACAGGVYVFTTGNDPVPEYTSVVITPTSFIQSVEETGVVDTDISVTYGWERSGRIIEVEKKEGDPVYTGDVIARLADTSERNALKQAQASLDRARASLNEALAGPGDEERSTYAARIQQAEASLGQAQTDVSKTKTSVAADIASAERAVQKARNDLQETATGGSQKIDDAYADLYNTLVATLPNLRDALSEADRIVGIDNVFANDAYEEYLALENPSTKNRAISQYERTKTSVADIENTLLGLTYTNPQSSLDVAGTDVQYALREMTLLLQYVLDILAATNPVGSFSQSDLDTLQSGVVSEKVSIAADSTSVTNAIQAVTAAKNATVTAQIAFDTAVANLAETRVTGDALIASAERVVDIRTAAVAEAKASYNALIAPPRSVDVAALRADVTKAEAAYEAAALDVADMTLTALTTGTITMLDIHIGETVTANQDVVTIQSDTSKIEVDISETDIAKITKGDIAKVEFDAYDGNVYYAYVRSIDPAATEISGVVYYTVELELPTNTSTSMVYPDDVHIDDLVVDGSIADIDVKPGMSADVEIITYATTNSIVLPRRALISTGDTWQARILTNPETVSYTLRDVTVGKTGNDGLIEIMSGISVGEEVITFLEEIK